MESVSIVQLMAGTRVENCGEAIGERNREMEHVVRRIGTKFGTKSHPPHPHDHDPVDPFKNSYYVPLNLFSSRLFPTVVLLASSTSFRVLLRAQPRK